MNPEYLADKCYDYYKGLYKRGVAGIEQNLQGACAMASWSYYQLCQRYGIPCALVLDSIYWPKHVFNKIEDGGDAYWVDITAEQYGARGYLIHAEGVAYNPPNWRMYSCGHEISVKNFTVLMKTWDMFSPFYHERNSADCIQYVMSELKQDA